MESGSTTSVSIPMTIVAQFEDELQRRGYTFSLDAESGRHVVEIGGVRMLISLDNLERDVTEGDPDRVARFVDAVIASINASDAPLSADRLYWSLEASDVEDTADFRIGVSDRVDRVLVHLSEDRQHIAWVTPGMLDTLGLSQSQATEIAFANLSQMLSQATIEIKDIEGTPLGFINTSLPFKASLMLAPNLREMVEDVLGWPLMAVLPDRDFLYLWPASHTDFVQRVGPVVVREFCSAAYPLSTEVYEITDAGIKAIGAFPVPDK